MDQGAAGLAYGLRALADKAERSEAHITSYAVENDLMQLSPIPGETWAEHRATGKHSVRIEYTDAMQAARYLREVEEREFKRATESLGGM